MKGVWAVYYYDSSAIVTSVHATELKALRAAQDAYAHVVWLPFGMPLRDAIAAADAPKAAGFEMGA